ncbi:GAP family protein [Microbacterium kunmingense]|uniref:GAP family protein n=1 Tax=Microbacterium kunmingense TaxID=2915939 RepID=UPI003D735FA0
MLAAIGQLLPIAAATAVSSVPITAMLVILLSPRRRQAAIPFLVGWLVGIAAVTSVCALGARLLPQPSESGSSVALGVTEVLVGGALVAGGLLTLRARVSRRTEARAWLGRVDALGPWSSFAVAVVLNLRPKALLLACAAGLVIRGASLTVGHATIVIAIYTVLAGSTIAVPIAMTMASPGRMEPRLVQAKGWLHRHARVISAVVLLMVGVVAVGNGLTRL